MNIKTKKTKNNHEPSFAMAVLQFSLFDLHNVHTSIMISTTLKIIINNNEIIKHVINIVHIFFLLSLQQNLLCFLSSISLSSICKTKFCVDDDNTCCFVIFF